MLYVIYTVFIVVAFTQGHTQTEDATKVLDQTDESKIVTASPVLENNDIQASLSSAVNDQVVSERKKEECIHLSPSDVDVSALVTQVSEQTVSQTTQDQDRLEASTSVIHMTSQNDVDQPETVTQSTPIDQLETPIKKDTFSLDEKSQSLDEVVNGQVQQPTPLKEITDTEITGEELLHVIKSLPEQPNGLHDQIPPTGGTASPGVDDPPADTDIDSKKDTDSKSEEEGLTFNEWTQKVLAEAEKDKQDLKEDTSGKPIVPTSKQRKKKNYASWDCGAKVLAFNPESTNPKSILNSNKDDYMINPCKVKKWIVIELCEPMQAYSVEIASLELFSSQPKVFRIYLSDRYPTKDWKLVGERTLKDERAVQSFDISESHDYFAKFVKVELVDHFGDEHFCPLTVFRVFGIAVNDYDISHDEAETENLEDDHILEGDMEEDSKNLFDSARDTVMTLVKKVLNVDPETGDVENKTEKAETSPGEISTNGTASYNLNDTKPVLPNASISEELEKDEQGQISRGEGQDQGQILPKVPQPGLTDKFSIVTKLEDDEQIETGSDWDQFSPKNKTILQDFIQCQWIILHRRKQKTRCKNISGFCQFISLILETASKISFENGKVKVSTKEDKKMPDLHLKADKADLFDSDSNQLGSSDIPPAFMSSLETKTEKQSTDLPKLKTTEISPLHSETSKDTNQLSVKSTQQIETESSMKEAQTKITSKVVSSDSLIKPTSTMDVMSDTISMEMSTSFMDTTMMAKEMKPESSVLKHSDTVQIDPSPTSAVEGKTLIETSPKEEPTPSLPESWKPDTKDVMNTGTQSAAESVTKTLDMSEQVTASSLEVELEDKTGQSEVLGTKLESAASSTQILKDLPPISNEEMTSGFSASAITPPMPDLEPAKIVPESASSQTPTVGVPVVTDAEVKVSQEDVKDTLEGQKTAGKSVTAEDKEEMKNTTKTDEKQTGDQKVKQDKNLDIKVPVMIGANRESAVMRLSNRIKVLEQNVSLSSRFLEELSKRYKKQSEDMMKLLNKTLAKLSNMTVENEVKNKIHEDEMYAMERRLQNLTEKVTHLTNNLQTLNQQVTDRQMIATSVEILIIIVLFLVVGRWTRKESLTPEVQKLIESMPSKPVSNLPRRRNSISGPATPSKTFSSDIHVDPGGTLNKCSSETSLDVIEPSQSLFSHQKTVDGVKKKKKKKQKSLDGKGNLTGIDISHLGFDEKSKLSEASPRLQTDTHNTNTSGNWSAGGGAISKKPPVPSGRKKEDESKAGSPNTVRRDKSFQKGHRRQKSLPKQHYTEDEFHARAFSDSHCSQSGDQSHIKHTDKNVSSHTQPTHRCEIKKAVDRRHSDPKTSHGKNKKHPQHDLQTLNGGYEDKPLREHYSILEGTHDYIVGNDRKHIDDIGPIQLGAMNNAQHSTQELNGFTDFEGDSVYNGEHFYETSQNFFYNDTSLPCAMKGDNRFGANDNQIDNDYVPVRENGDLNECDESAIPDRGFRKFWRLF